MSFFLQTCFAKWIFSLFPFQSNPSPSGLWSDVKMKCHTYLSKHDITIYFIFFYFRPVPCILVLILSYLKKEIAYNFPVWNEKKIYV